MDLTFKDKLWSEYPIPESVSVWGGNGVQLDSIKNLDNLISTCVDELKSDILVTRYMRASGLRTTMPADTVTVQSAMLTSNFMFQGNRLVKVTYDKGSRIAYLSYYPATITYKKYLAVDDLGALVGDQLIYTKAYILWKMAESELSILKAVNMNVDNGNVDWSVLESFRDKMYERYKILKEDQILMYASVN